jgi:hypothetical protein
MVLILRNQNIKMAEKQYELVPEIVNLRCNHTVEKN